MTSYRRQIRNEARYGVDPQGIQAAQQGLRQAQQDVGGAYQNYGQTRGQMGQLYGQLQDVAAGRGGPSLAELQMRQGMQQGVTDQMALASQGRGGTMAATGRQVQGMGAAGAMGLAQQTAQLRAQEQEAARAQLAQQAQAMAAMDQQQLANAQGYQYGMYGQQADIAAQNALADQQNRLGLYGMDLQRRQNNREFGMQIPGAAMQGVGSLIRGIFSDERLKTDIRGADEDVSNTLASLEPIGFKYKDARHGPTDRERLGVRAQDMQRTEAGRRVVKEVPGEGLMLDGEESISLLLAGAANLEKRMRKLEGRAA